MESRSAKDPTRSLCRGLVVLMLLAAAGCAARPYREVHATHEYHHHLEGTYVTTHAGYR